MVLLLFSTIFHHNKDMAQLSSAPEIWHGTRNWFYRPRYLFLISQPCELHSLHYGPDPFCGEFTRRILLLPIQETWMDTFEHILYRDWMFRTHNRTVEKQVVVFLCVDLCKCSQCSRLFLLPLLPKKDSNNDAQARGLYGRICCRFNCMFCLLFCGKFHFFVITQMVRHANTSSVLIGSSKLQAISPSSSVVTRHPIPKVDLCLRAILDR